MQVNTNSNPSERAMPKNALKQEAQQEYDDYLEQLRQSGVTNMFGAAPYLEQEFSLSRQEARDALMHWMKNYKREA